INFTDSGEVVLTVKAVKRGDLFDLGIIVADTGPGISEDKLASIFEPFVQGDAAGKKKSGTGLGLSIARRLVEAMGGSITARNRPEGGAEFTVLLSLPCVAPVTDQEADTLTVAPPYLTNISVVMVED